MMTPRMTNNTIKAMSECTSSSLWFFGAAVVLLGEVVLGSMVVVFRTGMVVLVVLKAVGIKVVLFSGAMLVWPATYLHTNLLRRISQGWHCHLKSLLLVETHSHP